MPLVMNTRDYMAFRPLVYPLDPKANPFHIDAGSRVLYTGVRRDVTIIGDDNRNYTWLVIIGNGTLVWLYERYISDYWKIPTCHHLVIVS